MANSRVSLVTEVYGEPIRVVQSELKEDEALLLVFPRLVWAVAVNGQVC